MLRALGQQPVGNPQDEQPHHDADPQALGLIPSPLAEALVGEPIKVLAPKAGVERERQVDQKDHQRKQHEGDGQGRIEAATRQTRGERAHPRRRAGQQQRQRQSQRKGLAHEPQDRVALVVAQGLLGGRGHGHRGIRGSPGTRLVRHDARTAQSQKPNQCRNPNRQAFSRLHVWVILPLVSHTRLAPESPRGEQRVRAD